jgi:anti-sigma-K factor RskA
MAEDNNIHNEEQLRRDRIEELAAAYALGALFDDEQGMREFEQLVESGDPYMAETLETMLDASTVLAFAAPQEEPRDAVRYELLSRIQHTKQDTRSRGRERGAGYSDSREPVAFSVLEQKLKKRTRTLVGVSVVAGLIMCVLGSLLIFRSAERNAREVAVNDLKKQRDSLMVMMGDMAKTDSAAKAMFALFSEKNSSVVTMASTAEKQPQTHRVYFSREQKKIFVMKESLPPLEKGKVYELWLIKGSEPPMPVGVFDISSKQSIFSFSAPHDDADAFAVSIEPEGGSKSPQGPVIMVGKVPTKL